MIKKLLIIFIVILLSACQQDTPSTPKLNLDRSNITVSGISSGGYMAHQYHIVYSDEVTGAALFASGPYGCARGDLKLALADCVNSQEPPGVDDLYTTMSELAESQKIASLKNLAMDKVWIFHGEKDSRVSREVTKSQSALYQKAGIIPQEVLNIPAGHGLPTMDFGVDCGDSKTPYLNHCSYDGAGEALKYFYRDLDKKASEATHLFVFEQSKFVGEDEENTLADIGYLYIPKACQKGEKCRLHIAFHGCLQNEENVAKAFVENAGYNAWAEGSNLVILYPQTKSSFMPLNPQACWDWWGYTGEEFQTRQGAQLNHINNMVKNL